MKPHATTAAIDARRRQTAQKLEQVEKAIGQLRRERGRLTVRSVAERADVSVTFLYENSKARALVSNAVDGCRRSRNSPDRLRRPRSFVRLGRA